MWKTSLWKLEHLCLRKRRERLFTNFVEGFETENLSSKLHWAATPEMDVVKNVISVEYGIIRLGMPYFIRSTLLGKILEWKEFPISNVHDVLKRLCSFSLMFISPRT